MSGDIQVHVYLKHGIVVYRNKVIGLVYLGPLVKTLNKRLVPSVQDKRLYTIPLPPHLNDTWAKLNEGSALSVLYLDPRPDMMDLMNDVAKVLAHDLTPGTKRYPSVIEDLAFSFYSKSTAYRLAQLNDLVVWGGFYITSRGSREAPILDAVARRIMRKLGAEAAEGSSDATSNEE